ncbi:MAG TPA: hypothetical protein VFW66_13935 [Gemmatimonadales bacterium]|nr:hypothetical protein [Gemmatimonadales bacterium]
MRYQAFGWGALALGALTSGTPGAAAASDGARPGTPHRAPAAAPVAAHYRIDQTVEQIVDASALGGGEERQRFSVSTFLALTLTDSAGGRTVHAVVDSMRGDSTTPVPRTVLDSARGVALHGFVTRSGKLVGVQPLTPTPLAAQLTAVVRQLFPPVRQGIKVGDGWADTTESSNAAGGGTVTIRRVTRYRATGAESHGGMRAVKIETAFTASVTGTQQMGEGTANVEGSGTGKETYYIAPDGHYLDGNSTQISRLTISGAFAPKPLPVQLTETFAASALR